MTDAQFEDIITYLDDIYSSIDVLTTDVHNWIGVISFSILVLIGIKVLAWLVRW